MTRPNWTSLALWSVLAASTQGVRAALRGNENEPSSSDVRSLFKQVPEYKLNTSWNKTSLFGEEGVIEGRDLQTTVRSLQEFILNTFVLSHTEASVWYTELETSLEGPGPFSVFFTWDNEWSRQPYIEKLKDYFYRGHLRAYYMHGVLMDKMPPWSIPASGRTVYTMGGSPVQVTAGSNNNFFVNGKRAMAVQPLLNGDFYLLQDMIPPPFLSRTVYDVISSEYSTFVTLLVASGQHPLLQDYSEAVGRTALVPTNAAFERVGPNFAAWLMSPAGASDRYHLVRYHIIDMVLHTINLVPGQNTPLATVQGTSVTVYYNGVNAMTISDVTGQAAVSYKMDILAYNGLVHEINSVLRLKNYGSFPHPAPLNVGAHIQNNVPYSSAVFSDANSYRSQAYNWVVGNCVGCAANGQRIMQRYVLACIWFSTWNKANPLSQNTIGSAPGQWANFANWMNALDECTWYGITCNSNGYIKEIRLRNNNLSGTFPSETALLAQSLEVLDLTNNLMYNDGPENNNWLGDLSKLKYLSVRQTGFSYNGIPTAIGRLTELTDLDVSYCLYMGNLQSSVFTNLNKVTYLDISGNSYLSPAPSSIGNMASLKYFYAVNADLEGDLNFITSSSSIEEIWIDDNPNFGGGIPASIQNCGNLRSLSLTDNNMGGGIPVQLANCKALQQVWLFGNNFVGGIPAQIANLGMLRRFEVFDNNLGGGVPGQMCGLGLASLAVDCGEVSCPCCTCCTNCRVPGDTP